MDFKLNKSNLNFHVYTASTLPSTAQENDICVISDVPMKNWILSPDAPSGAPRTDGDVWIQYSVTGGTFNALKTGAMMVAAIFAWQYVDGAWATRTAKSHQGGLWKDWVVYLYKAGEGKKVNFVTKNSSGATVTFDANSIVIKATSSAEACVRTENLVDLSNFSQIIIRAKCTSQYVGSDTYLGRFLASASAFTGSSVPTPAAQVILDADSIAKNYTIDVSGLNGSFYVGYWGCSTAEAFDIYLI